MFFVLKNVIRLVVSLVCLSPIIVPLLAIERKPLVSETDQQAFDGVGSATEILGRFDPRSLSSDVTTKVSVSDSEISHAIGAVLSRLGTGHGRVQVAKDGVVFQGTAPLPVPETFFGRYLNVEARIAPSDKELEVSSLSVGSISVPGWIIKPSTIYFLDWFMGEGKGEPIYSSIRSVEVAGEMITVGVQPPPGLVGDVKEAAGRALKLDNAEAIRSYYLTLAETSLSQGTTPISLAAYLGPVFSVAQERSQSGDPIEENRAVILALAMYFGDARFQALLSNVKTDDADDGGFDVAAGAPARLGSALHDDGGDTGCGGQQCLEPDRRSKRGDGRGRSFRLWFHRPCGRPCGYPFRRSRDVLGRFGAGVAERACGRGEGERLLSAGRRFARGSE